MWRKNKKKKKREEQKIDCMIGVWVIKKKNGEKMMFLLHKIFWFLIDFWSCSFGNFCEIYLQLFVNCSFSIDKDLWTVILFFNFFGFCISYFLFAWLKNPWTNDILCSKTKKEDKEKKHEQTSWNIQPQNFTFLFLSTLKWFPLCFKILYLILLRFVSYCFFHWFFFFFVFYFPFVVILRGFYWLNWIFSPR